jgi:fructokinase
MLFAACRTLGQDKTMTEQNGKKSRMRIGVDMGGTKIEFIALDGDGRELLRHRVDTPRFDYGATLRAVAGNVEQMERDLGCKASVGVGIPGTISTRTGLVKNANSTWMIGKPFDRDLSAALDRPVRCANDANCLAVSEATDGAGAGQHVVFAAILGTGCGGGIAIDARVHTGRNAVAGEWGHNPLPWARPDEYPGARCYCGRDGCLEMWISGTGLAADYARATKKSLTGAEIAALGAAGEPEALRAIERYEDRLARGLSYVVNLLDPDVIVLGGGVSQIPRLYQNVPAKLRDYVFGKEADTPVLPAKHGDSSGVRGAAWLWPLADA